MSILNKVKPPTGEPDAGDPHVRFGGRGGCECILPYPYQVVNLPSKKKFTTWIPAFEAVSLLSNFVKLGTLLILFIKR